MSLKSLVSALTLAVGMVAFADPMGAQPTVERGKWCSDFPAARAYAEANNIPMLVFWANPGCSQCVKLENACKEDDFVAWQAQRQMVMVFAYGKTSKEQKAAYDWITSVQKIKKFPFIGVYWASNTKGDLVSSVFVGRKGMMPVKTGSLQEQLMASVDREIAGWNPGGAPTPTPAPEPEVDVREQAYGAQRKASLLVSSSQLGSYIGTASATIGKLKDSQVKVTVKLSLFTGKSLSANKTVEVAKDGSAAGILAFRSPADSVAFQLTYDAANDAVALAGIGESIYFETTALPIGGALAADQLTFNGSISAQPPEGYAFVTDVVPVGEPIYVKSGVKFSFDKTPTLKYTKVDDEWVLQGLDDLAKPNVNALKLTYKSSSGIFSGSFYTYISNAPTATGKPKLTKCKATVYGAFIGGVGYGQFNLKVGNATYPGGTGEIK